MFTAENSFNSSLLSTWKANNPMFSDSPQERYPYAEKVGRLSQMKPRSTMTRLVAPNGRIGKLLALSPEINTTSATQSGKKQG